MKLSKKKYLFVGIFFTLLGTFLSPIFFHSTNTTFFLQADPKKELSPAKTQAISLEAAFGEVFDSVSPSVVSIATEKTIKFNQNQFPFDPFF